MRFKEIMYPFVFIFIVLIPFMRYYASTPWINSCVTDYVDNIETSNYKWYLYKIDWQNHIEPANSTSLIGLENYKTWVSTWCIMSSWDFFSDINNTFYCAMSYMIRKSPMDNRFKTPLSLLTK